MNLISKAGKFCYTKNPFLRQELDDSRKSSSTPRKPISSSDKTPDSSPTSKHKEDNVFFGTAPPAIRKLEEDRHAQQAKKAEEKRLEILENTRETRTQILRRAEFLKTGGLTPSRGQHPAFARPSTIAVMKKDDVYKHRLEYALKGFEFEAIARRSPPGKMRRTASLITISMSKTRKHLRMKTRRSKYLERELEIPAASPSSANVPRFNSGSPGHRLLQSPTDAHEHRFDFNPRDFDYLSLIRYRPFPVVDFKKLLPRDPRMFSTRINSGTPLYSVEETRGKQRGKSVLPFEKMTARNSSKTATKEGQAYITQSSSLTTSRNYEQLSTTKRTIAPSFDKSKARYQKGQTLPSFMENVNSRMALTGLSIEMLKANKYRECDFMAEHTWSHKTVPTIMITSCSHPLNSPMLPQLTSGAQKDHFATAAEGQ